jgi:hypothetical protein
MEDETEVAIPQPVEDETPVQPVIPQPAEDPAPAPPVEEAPAPPVDPPKAKEQVVFDGTPDCAGCGKCCGCFLYSKGGLLSDRRQDDWDDVLHSRRQAVLREVHGRTAYAHLSPLQEEDNGRVSRVLQLQVP